MKENALLVKLVCLLKEGLYVRYITVNYETNVKYNLCSYFKLTGFLPSKVSYIKTYWVIKALY